jgi:hypothetical protein
MVYLPKDEGGLWVLDFKKQNESLLMHKFYNRLDVKLIWQKYYSSGQLQVSIPGASFWWRDILKLLSSFKGTDLKAP